MLPETSGGVSFLSSERSCCVVFLVCLIGLLRLVDDAVTPEADDAASRSKQKARMPSQAPNLVPGRLAAETYSAAQSKALLEAQSVLS